jgi:hypothetical protein
VIPLNQCQNHHPINFANSHNSNERIQVKGEAALTAGKAGLGWAEWL